VFLGGKNGFKPESVSTIVVVGVVESFEEGSIL
jgi:hypothetical protein